MNHETVTELLPWYVNGTLAPHERAAVDAELATCPLCAAELAELQRVHEAMHEIDKDAPGPSEALMSRTLARIATEEGRKSEPPAWLAWWTTMPLTAKLAAGALVVVLMLFAFRHNFEQSVMNTAQPVASEPISAPADQVKPNAAANVYSVPQSKSLSAQTRVGAIAGGPAAGAAPAPARESVSTVNNAVNPLRVQRFAASQRPQLIRTGSINLIVPDVERALAQLAALAQLQFGDVTSLTDETPSAPGVRHTAQVQLAVPADRFNQTMDALAKLGAVQSRTIGAENVTDQIVDAQARLRNLRRTEIDMLRILDRAGKIPDVLEVTQQIAQVREQIEQLDGQLQSLQHRVAYSTVTIGIEDEKPVASAEPGMGTQLNDAWKSALRQVKAYTVRVLSAVLVIVAFAPYWVAALLVVLLIGYRFRKP